MNSNKKQTHIQELDSYITLRKKDYYGYIYEFFKKKQVKTVIDVGGASGDFSFYGPENIRYLSTDISEELIEIARETRSKKNIEFVVDNILKTSVKQKYDAVLMLGTITTFPDLSNVLKNLCNLSNKYLLIHAPINRYEFDSLIAHKRSSEPSENYQNSFNIFSAKTLENELLANNFKVIKLEKFVMTNTLKRVDSPKRLTSFHIELDGEKSLINQLGLVLDEHIIIAEKCS